MQDGRGGAAVWQCGYTGSMHVIRQIDTRYFTKDIMFLFATFAPCCYMIMSRNARIRQRRVTNLVSSCPSSTTQTSICSPHAQQIAISRS
ncbi:hypothetical protein CONLIGDRAFT_454224 [Coniochaeta ligniaria NRRL 30616]|uniref:Uncharacterized protein n=1 Tax=Coniochaeta ligniaria NRRL 30616 TaxID=1408157 RepID=A0A1J7IK16_9PEZI|nr:hypothetical protein CONLIGDRAFT_454224 [Coniochaeta ligniaria NRRL 30616]